MALGATLFDTQSQQDTRGLKINRVGVCDVRFPLTVKTRDAETTGQNVVGTFSMQVDLPAEQKGTHMSRFLESLHNYADTFSADALVDLCNDLTLRLDSARSFVKVEFPYFTPRLSPVTNKLGKAEHRVVMEATNGTRSDSLVLSVLSPITTLCPCSKAISEYGAHNQRGSLDIAIKSDAFIWIEEIVGVVERVGSANVYPILKRPDEKFVTEQAYANPKFVEDVVRDAAGVVAAMDSVTWYRIRCTNFESIHAHNAFAELESIES